MVVKHRCRRRSLAGLLLVSLCMVSAAALADQDVVVLLDSSAATVQSAAQRQGLRALSNFINGLGPDTRVALLSFGAQPQRLVPFTTLDVSGRRRIEAALQRVRFAGAAANASAGLEGALAELLDHAYAQANKSIVVIAQGNAATRLAANPNASRWILRSLVPAANFNQVRVFTLVHAPSAQGALQTLAQETGGTFFAVTGPADFAAALHALGPRLAAPAAVVPTVLPLPSVAALSAKFSTPLTRVPRLDGGFHWWWLALAILVVAVIITIYAVWSLRASRAPKSHPKLLEPAAGGAHAVLYDISNPNDIRRFELDERATLLGRVAGYDPDVQYILIREKTVGRCHAVIERRGHTFWLTDQGSVNGTFVNGERITADYALKHGDIVAVHRHEFEFMIPEYFESDATVVGAREAAAA